MKNKIQEAEKFRYLILAVQRQGNKVFKDLLKEIGITPSQAEVIHILKESQAISLKELGELLICEGGSPSRLIERMVKDRLVERVRDQNDSRFVRLQLTCLGNEKHASIAKIEMKLYEMLDKTFTVDELAYSNQILDRFLIGTPLSDTLARRGYSHKLEDKEDQILGGQSE